MALNKHWKSLVIRFSVPWKKLIALEEHRQFPQMLFSDPRKKFVTLDTALQVCSNAFFNATEDISVPGKSITEVSSYAFFRATEDISGLEKAL